MVEWGSAGLKEGVPAHPIAAGKMSCQSCYILLLTSIDSNEKVSFLSADQFP